MNSIDIKVRLILRLILRLNAKLKRSELYLRANDNVPPFMRDAVNKATIQSLIIRNVLNNLNYLNY